MRYKKIVEEIRSIPWPNADLPTMLNLMILSGYAALEFSKSLKIARLIHPNSEAFELMAAGELETDNLQFGDYSKKGDHFEFLWHFIDKHGLPAMNSATVAVDAGEAYLKRVFGMDYNTRVMSIVSREQELPGIFEAILKAEGWDEHPALQAFRYFLKRHIELDSGEGGHADLLSGFPVDDRVEPFYAARLEMYRQGLPALFRVRSRPEPISPIAEKIRSGDG